MSESTPPTLDPEDTPPPRPHHHHRPKTDAVAAVGLIKALGKVLGAMVVLLGLPGASAYGGYSKANSEKLERMASLEAELDAHVAESRADSKAWREAMSALELRTSNEITALTTTVSYLQRQIDEERARRLDVRRQPRGRPVGGSPLRPPVP